MHSMNVCLHKHVADYAASVMSHLLSVSEVGLGQLLHTHRDHFIFLAVIKDNVCPSIPEMSFSFCAVSEEMWSVSTIGVLAL